MSQKVLSALLLVGLLAGCGADGGRGTGGSAPPTAPTGSPAVPGADKVLDRAQLERALLTVGDMPTGYSRSSDDSDDTVESQQPDDGVVATVSDPECGRFFQEFQDTGRTVVDPSTVAVEYEKSDLGPLVEHELTAYPDPARPRAEIAKVNEAVTRCGQFILSEPDGDITIKVTGTQFPALGDESAAFKLNATGSSADFDLTMSGYLVAIRVGNTLCTVVHFGWPAVEAAETEQVARKAAEKLTPLAR